MKQVTAAMQQRVTAKLQEGLNLANKHYKLQLTMPRVTYDLGGATAGQADYQSWHIKLNPGLLIENLDDFIARTVPHELAHLVTDRVYPQAHESRVVFTVLGRIRAKKRELHGPHWRAVARVLGVSDITRCHQYDVTNVARRKARYEYKCAGCKKVLNIGPKIHKQLQARPDSRWHKPCRGSRLTLVGHQPAKRPEKVVVAQPQGTRVPVQVAPGATKQQRAFAIYQELKDQYDRAAIITRFIRDLGMTKAGASTYYYNCQKQG